MTAALTLYRETGSLAERLDPRSKIVAAGVAVVALIASDSLPFKATVVLALVVAWVTARLGLKLLAGTLASLTFFFLTTLILRGVIRGAAAPDATLWGPLRVSPSGLLDGATMCCQIAGIVLALTVLVRSTEPIQLAEGGERLLAPLKRFGVPAHEAVMMFSIALRFLPIMLREVGRMQAAQLARGGGIQRGNALQRTRAVVPLVIPVVIVALVRARELAEAMDSRGYRGDVGRTAIRAYRLGAADVVLIVGVATLLGVAVVGRLV